MFTNINIKEIIKKHPRVSKRLKEIPKEIKSNQEQQNHLYARAHSQGRSWIRADESRFFRIQQLKTERTQLLNGGPFWDEGRKEYLERCASIFIDAIYQLEKNGDRHSADHGRLERYLESINAQLSAPDININVKQTVNVIQAMGILM